MHMSKHSFCQQLKLLLCNKIREICWRNMTGALPGLPVISFQSPKRTAARILLSNGLFGSLCPTGWNNGSMLCRIELLLLTADPSLQTIYDSITENLITSFIKYAPVILLKSKLSKYFFFQLQIMNASKNLHFSDKRWHIIIGVGLRKLLYYM